MYKYKGSLSTFIYNCDNSLDVLVCKSFVIIIKQI